MSTTKKRERRADATDREQQMSQQDAAAEKYGAQEETPLSEPLRKAENEASENYDRFLRLSAEFENFKKRAEREMSEFRKFANESLLREVLPVIDNLERALSAECDENEKAVKCLRDGIEMTLKGLLDTLEKFGVVVIEALGKPFDPHFHQAVSQQESDTFSDNAVCQELQKGYLLNDRLLRPAMVIVAKNSRSQEATPADKGGGSSKKVKVTIR